MKYARAPPVFWSRSLEHTLNSSPPGLEVSKSLVLHHHFLVPIGALGNMIIRYKNPKIKNGFEYSGTQHMLQNYTLITML